MDAERSSKHENDGVSLPEDIIFDVLVRLPVKALCRFRCVSKAWRTLISEPAFFAAQRSCAGDLIVAVFESGMDHELRVLDMHGNVLRVFEVNQSADQAPTRLDLIFVDMTRLGAMIVDPAARKAFTVGRDMDRAYWTVFSFGRATPSGTYKIQRVYKTHAMVCEVSTITDGGATEPTWRQRPLPTLFTSFSSLDHRATVNGILYFMPNHTYERNPGWNQVAAFDLESEAWMEAINGPPLGLKVEQAHWDVVLTELKGTLCMVHIIRYWEYEGGLCLYANIWCLIDCKKSIWVKAYTIPMPKWCSDIQVWDVLDDGRILLLSALVTTSSYRYVLQFFSPSTEAFTDIMEMGEGFSGTMAFYTGSLLSS